MNIIVSTLAIVGLAATCVLACLLARLYEVTAGCKIDVLAPLSWAAGVLLFVIGFSLPSVVAADHLVLRALLGATFGGFAGIVLMSAWKSQKMPTSIVDASTEDRA
jgi:uncharacterized SAM-binding protein YcdF (DUF218 family)